MTPTADVVLDTVHSQIEQLYRMKGYSNSFTDEDSALYLELLDVEERMLLHPMG